MRRLVPHGGQGALNLGFATKAPFRYAGLLLGFCWHSVGATGLPKNAARMPKSSPSEPQDSMQERRFPLGPTQAEPTHPHPQPPPPPFRVSLFGWSSATSSQTRPQGQRPGPRATSRQTPLWRLEEPMSLKRMPRRGPGQPRRSMPMQASRKKETLPRRCEVLGRFRFLGLRFGSLLSCLVDVGVRCLTDELIS